MAHSADLIHFLFYCSYKLGCVRFRKGITWERDLPTNPFSSFFLTTFHSLGIDELNVWKRNSTGYWSGWRWLLPFIISLVGLGRAAAVMLANRGMKVVFADPVFSKPSVVQETQSLLRHRENGLFVSMDITQSESILSCLDQIDRTYSAAPSLVVHCAGVTTSHPVRSLFRCPHLIDAR